jgi:hypothetical protein
MVDSARDAAAGQVKKRNTNMPYNHFTTQPPTCGRRSDDDLLHHHMGGQVNTHVRRAIGEEWKRGRKSVHERDEDIEKGLDDD